ncbi:ABC transporter ATP-binding protein [Natronomonas sp.]|uniref:ABC transporter ATP-binding protein n=1 Tax=Natronomonas sp. TaxID=2184060 RepID=UPI002870691E|nr:ABC transporter ATP-binding protein [Natronomonas sp.]
MLEIDNLQTRYETEVGDVHAVDGVSFSVDEKETLGLVGESGCGKTTLAKSIFDLLPRNGYVAGGSVVLNGTDITELSEKELRRRIRWQEISMIPQTAMNGLDPVQTVGAQIIQVIRTHEDVSKKEARQRAKDLFEELDLEPERISNYPHQFSGGMAQRAMIALSLALSPSVILADEPTTALDVMIQDRILRLINRIKDEYEMGMIMITHDMSVVSETCDTTAVMYAGRVVEYADTETVIKNPRHPYTMGLRNAFPDISEDAQDLVSVPGEPPELIEPEPGCKFAPRCPFAVEECWETNPKPQEFEDGHIVECHRADEAETIREEASKSETWREMAEDAPAQEVI